MTQTLPEASSPGKKIITVLKFSFFLGLGLVIIWLSLKDLTAEERAEIIHSFKTANYSWVLLAIILGVFSHVIRAARWVLFFEPMGFKPKLKTTFYAVMVGYFANMAFPRLGEVTRCGIMSKYEKVPFQKALGTVVTERAIDMLIFFLLFLLMFFTQLHTIKEYLNQNMYPKLVAKFGDLHYSRMIFLFLLGLLVLVVGLWYAVRKKVKASKTYHKVTNLIIGFWEGLKSLSQVKKPGLFIFYSLVIWVLYFFMLYVIFFCFAETSGLGLGAGLSSLVLGSVGIMITPGGIGLYPAIIQETLLLYGIAKPTGLALGWIAWTAQTLMILVFGGVSLLLLSIKRPENGKA
ncbi:MAG: lysylphosphatidylglycerol synthase transmembrane domain-containing protein [Bacteroidetes bacterium]|nr:lysylphosphatidylglycerol synthase transmembrane domain-containing protein [Bacteroidota bacterium]